MRTGEWLLVGLWCVLVPAGIVTALKPSAFTPRRARSTRRGGLLMVLTGVGSLCDLLPIWLGWPTGVRGAFAIVALVMATGMAVLAVLGVIDRVRPPRGRPGDSTAMEYSNRADR